MFGEISNTDDFEDQIRCVGQKEEHKHKQFMNGLLILDVFQLESNVNNQDGVTTTKASVDVEEHQIEIKSKLKIDLVLGEQNID